MRSVPPSTVPPLSRDTLLFWAKHPELNPLRCVVAPANDKAELQSPQGRLCVAQV